MGGGLLENEGGVGGRAMQETKLAGRKFKGDDFWRRGGLKRTSNK